MEWSGLGYEWDVIWMNMDDESWYVWSGWWNGMNSIYEMEWKNIRTALQSMTCVTHLQQDIKLQILTWKWGVWSMEWDEWYMEWSEVWMNEWNGVWMDKWNASENSIKLMKKKNSSS